uniref:response regulator transcription factor n=1 Tax=Sphingomonas bacterium TaxID=1895847 RepID=UPI00262CE769|nr:response regulator [Sphingomonas bacterium]
MPVIAVVDDDAGVRGSIDSLLRSAGMAPLVFSRGEDLLTSDVWATIGCVLTDLHMPGISGIELQQEMTKRGWQCPVIVMTAFPTSASRDRALAAGAIAFLTKPVDPDCLLNAIGKAIA